MIHTTQFALTHGAASLYLDSAPAGVPIPSVPLLIAAGSLAGSRRLPDEDVNGRSLFRRRRRACDDAKEI
jgi:hypothetical protein